MLKETIESVFERRLLLKK